MIYYLNYLSPDRAIFSRKKHTIEFRNGSDLNDIILTHLVKPHKPRSVSKLDKSTLLYVDGATTPNEVRYLNCSVSPPKRATVVGVTHTTQQNPVAGICTAQFGDKTLLVTTDKLDSVNAYDIAQDRIVWQVKGKLTGMESAIRPRAVALDGRGHLLVCDTDCVWMLSTDGVYMGVVFKIGERIGKPENIFWCSRNRWFLIHHYKDNRNMITSVEIDI